MDQEMKQVEPSPSPAPMAMASMPAASPQPQQDVDMNQDQDSPQTPMQLDLSSPVPNNNSQQQQQQQLQQLQPQVNQINGQQLPGQIPGQLPLPGQLPSQVNSPVSVGTPGQVPGLALPAPVIKRRAPIACRRCRRMRSKCLHDKAQPPCQACRDAGLGPADCTFPVRGQPDQDREYRHPRMRADKSTKRDPAKVRREILDAPVRSPVPAMPRPIKGYDEWDLLPPLPEIVEAVHKFTAHYFQLGFIHKQHFPERLRTNHRSVSVFFLLSILSISARLTPTLVDRFGGAVKAAEVFMERASEVACRELYRDPDLERCQAFYLLSIAQQGSSLKQQSSINMAIAMRMATLMGLHREETYRLPENPSEELIMRAESARRTLWMLHSQDNLHSGPRCPVSLSASDITALLPCNEKDFATGQIPKSRAALQDTPPALENPSLVTDEGRSLFATLIQAHYFWGAISRRVLSNDKVTDPWEPESEYAIMVNRLAEWERGLPNDHRWSSFLLKGYKQEGQDLAYLGVTMITRLCNIVLRKAYLTDILSDDKSQPERTAFWTEMSRQLFSNVRDLYEQIDTQYNERSPEEGPGAQMAAFCVYSCGFLACYLCKYPNLCPEPAITREGPLMVARVLSILAESRNIWPLATRWYEHLERFYTAQSGVIVGNEGTMADSRDEIPHVLQMPTVQQQQAQAQAHMALAQAQAQAQAQQAQQAQVQAQQPSQQHLAFTAQMQAQQAQQVQQALSEKQEPVPQGSPEQAIISPAQPSVPTPAMFIDPSLRVPTSSQPQEQTPAPQQQELASPSQQGQQPQPAVAGVNGRQSTDGLGLLIEAFDTQQAGGVPPTTTAGQGQVPYDPQAPPQQYYPQPGTLGVNDGYENELGYYMSDQGQTGAMQSWVGGTNMYGY